MTIRRAPLPTDLVAPACDTPPTDLGRVARPPHPAFGAGFAALLGLALEAGAIATPAAAPLELLIACVAAGACLAGVMHFGDGTALQHVPAKLAFARSRWRWMAAAAVAMVPAAMITGRAFATGTSVDHVAWSRSEFAMSVLAILAAATWIEMSARGYAFRACMGRHGFAFAAALGAVASLAGMLPLALEFGRDPLQRAIALALEVPLSLALAALTLRSGSLFPALAVRVALLAAFAATGNAFAVAPAALVLWIAAGRR